MSTQTNIVVFTRYPRPGRTKTRLIPAVGPEGAARIHRQMAGGTVLEARVAASRAGARLQVVYRGARRRAMRRWLGMDLEYVPQAAGELGARMHRVFLETLGGAGGRTVIVGTDCPGLTAALLTDALESLGANDVVIGPALDGGYYLIGLRRPAPGLFEGIPWGTGDVLGRTLTAAGRSGMSVKQLPVLSDVDTGGDLERIAPERRPSPPARGSLNGGARVSVIVPARNEADVLAASLASVREMARPGEEVEIIVADGGSSDETVRLAAEAGARVVRERAQRAVQLNAGALAATGDILLFLHADTRLPPGYPEIAREILSRPGTVAGAFRLAIDGRGASLRVIERFANLRSGLLRMPYGDQGLFLTRSTFRETGGYAHLPIMDDFELVRRLAARGRIITGPSSCRTSARRWEALGPFRTVLVNQAIVLAYHLGVSTSSLAAWYGSSRKKAR